MVLELKLRKIGNSVGVVLPREVLTHLHAGEGDTVCVTEATDGSLRLCPTKPEVMRQLKAAEHVIRRYRNALRELAR
jgi:putative addiction module antidote